MRADASVIVLDLDDEPRRPVISRSADRRRRFRIRPGPLLGIAAAHIAVIALAIAIPGEIVRVPETEPIVTVFIRPKVVVARDPPVTPRGIRVPKAAPLLFDAKIPDVDRPAIVIVGIGTMSPHPDDAAIDARPFAQRAGLRAGEGATVVLRVEVLGSGDVGNVEVDVSGGSEEIDGAAVAYVRSLPWVGGAIDGRPATMWIRWGVRLQA